MPSQPGSQGHMPNAPMTSHMPMGPMHGGPMMMQRQPQGMPYPNHPPQPWPQPAPGKPFALSGQMVLLIVVGVICVGIFVTGIVLFVTTKF